MFDILIQVKASPRTTMDEVLSTVADALNNNTNDAVKTFTFLTVEDVSEK